MPRNERCSGISTGGDGEMTPRRKRLAPPHESRHEWPRQYLDKSNQHGFADVRAEATGANGFHDSAVGIGRGDLAAASSRRHWRVHQQRHDVDYAHTDPLRSKSQGIGNIRRPAFVAR